MMLSILWQRNHKTMLVDDMSVVGDVRHSKSIIFNHAGIEVYMEKAPPLSGRDRQKLMQRRLLEALPESMLRYCKSLSREHQIFVGLDLNEEQDHTVDGILRNSPATSQVYLAPFVLQTLAGKLRAWKTGEWGMLLTRHRGGWRHTVFLGNDVVLTRLVPHMGSAQSITQEVLATIGYLGRLGLRDRGNLHVLTIGQECPLISLDGAGSNHALA